MQVSIRRKRGLLNRLFDVALDAAEVVLDRTVADLEWKELLKAAGNAGVKTWRRKREDIEADLRQVDGYQ